MKGSSKNLIVLVLLIAIGISAHYQSFNLSLYGDDWLFIYRYLTHYDPFVHINTMLPGILKYLAPYGPSIFLVGTEYQIFGQNYFLYYLVALIFKIFASFALFLVCKKITKSILISLLVAILFLVGFTGIQTTDWVFYSNVYLAVGLFFIGLLLQIKNSLLYFIFSLLAILVAPVRLYPLVFIVPLTDFILLAKDNFKKKNIFFNKVAFFGLIIIIFWLIGVFGGPAKIYSPGDWTVRDFTNFVTTQPLFTIKSFFYWIGTIFIPESLTGNQRQVILVGFGFLIVSMLALVQNRVERGWVILSTVTFLIFFLTMWFFSPNRLIGSADRYLLPTFASGCFLIGILVKKMTNGSTLLKYLGYLVLVILIIFHASATRNMYNYWLSKGRDISFAKKVDMQIAEDFPLPVISPKIIFLQSDDAAILHSMQFGLLFKITILSNTLNIKYFNDIFNEKPKLIEAVALKIDKGESKQDVINSVYAYGYINNKFLNITKPVREELSNIVGL